jgi:hypothetical protein
MIPPEEVSVDESSLLGSGKTYKATYGNKLAAVKVLSQEVTVEVSFL